ncbi:hypothetical protein QCA50_000200 [Cerrena zonata]|uniref:HBS1-like protein n=1 Tax=Cerrena zonata TaxID=2478898 RepID=A0AAW0GUB2_9APHY
MSRHRDVRNMNLEDEMDDQAFSEGEEDLSPADYEQLMRGLEHIRGILGPEEASEISDREIKDTLYHYYFNVQESLNWLIEEQQRKNVARARKAAKEKEKQDKALKLAQQKKAAEATSKLTQNVKKGTGAKRSGTSTPYPRQLDIAALNLEDEYKPPVDEPPPKISVSREKVLEEARKQLEGTGDKKSVSLVVIGHVDAGKSTLMGRLLYELGRVDEKTRVANERASSKIGKSSFQLGLGA